MAAFQRLFRASAAPAAALGGAVAYAALTPAAKADDGLISLSVQPGRSPRGDKLPIYPSTEVEEPVLLVVTPNPLADVIGTGREAVTNAFGSVRGVAEDGVSGWIGFERQVEREVRQIKSPEEPLTPGLIYVLVAGLTGSVLTRTRAFPIRFLTPPLLTLAALPYFLPKTAHNLRKYISDIEDKHAPEFAASHDQFNHNLEAHWHMALDKMRGATDEARQWSNTAADSVSSATGLRVSEAVRHGEARAEAAAQAARAKVSKTVASLREEVHTPAAPVIPRAQPVVLQKVAEVVETKPIAEIVVPVAASPEQAAAVEATIALPERAGVPAASNLAVKQVPAEVIAAAQPPAGSKPVNDGKRLV